MLLAVAVLLVTSVVGCRTAATERSLQRFEFQQPHMGTLFTIILYAPDESAARQASDAAFARIAALEDTMTDYDPESELMRLCDQPYGRPVHVSADLFEVIARAEEMAELSGGAFDPTIGPVIRLWRRARRTAELPAPQVLARAQAAVGWRKLKLDPRQRTITLTVPKMQLDLGGLGKGFAADKALETLKSQGIRRALIAASGDIVVSEPPPGKPGWRIGVGMIERKDSRLARNFFLRNAAVSTAGDSEQFVEIDGVHYSHIVDPCTGLGLTNRLQVSVIARHGTDTDACDTAVRVMGVKPGLALVERLPGLAAFILKLDGEKIEAIESSRLNRIPRVP